MRTTGICGTLGGKSLPGGDMNLALLLARAAASFGDRPAVPEGVEPRLDYAGLDRIARCKRPKDHLVVDALPRSN